MGVESIRKQEGVGYEPNSGGVLVPPRPACSVQPSLPLCPQPTTSLLLIPIMVSSQAPLGARLRAQGPVPPACLGLHPSEARG